MPITLDGTTGATVPAVSDSGNLTFTGTGNRITGDFSNTTLANRVMFQSSTTNGLTAISAFPNGTATVSTLNLYNNSDLTNNSVGQLQANSVEVRVLSDKFGTGSYLPMTFYTNGSEQMRISTAGIVTGTAGNLMLVQGTSQTAPFTTNTQCDFTGIPSWAKRVSIILSGVSTSSTSPLLIQLGSGSITSTGYASGGWTSSATYATATNGLLVSAAIVAAAVQHGVYTLALVTGNTWVGSGSIADSSGNNYTGIGSGTIALSGALDRIRVTTATGTPTFDTGSIINFQYE
jgi:hypothetical protein